MKIEPVTLQGKLVRLEPLRLDHVPGLARVGLDAELWRWIPHIVKSEDEMRAYVERALDAQQRGGANTECKLLLLTHAFETLGANRVELKTDFLNQKSRNAIERIGAKQEGVFRRHVIP